MNFIFIRFTFTDLFRQLETNHNVLVPLITKHGFLSLNFKSKIGQGIYQPQKVETILLNMHEWRYNSIISNMRAPTH